MSGESYRSIAKRTGLSAAALLRHKPHIPQELMRLEYVKRLANADSVLETLRIHGERLQLMSDACDRYLRDPADLTRYDVGPRAHDIEVVYEEGPDDDGEEGGAGRRPERKKALLSDLLHKVEGGGMPVYEIRWKISDPRDLALKTANTIGSQLELIARLSGELLAAKTAVQVNTQIINEAPKAPPGFEEILKALDGR